MSHSFIDSTHKPETFFNILPADWQEGIVPFWSEYQNTAHIITIESAEEVLGGGILFSTVSPDAMPYKEEAQLWFDEGYLYIGFFWVSEKHRDKKLGSQWLHYIKNTFPDKKLWLTIDEYGLSSFYAKNGFQLIKRLDLGDYEEWVLATENRKEVIVGA